MPYAYDPNEDDQQGVIGGGKPASSPGDPDSTTISTAGSTAGGGSGQTAKAAGANSSGDFTNLQSYLTANSGQNFGQQVAGKVQGQVDNANTAQSAADTGFKKEADSNTVAWNPDLVKNATDDPNKFVQDQGNVDQFTKMRTATYGGPKNLSEDSSLYNPANDATNVANQAANASQTESGRKSLLDQYYGRSDYQNGQKNLDNLLIQNDQGSRQAFANVQDNAKNSASNFGNLQNSLAGYATNAANTDASTAAQTNAALGDATTGFQTSLTNDYGTALTDKHNAASGLGARLDSGQVSSDDVQKYGLPTGPLYHVGGAPLGVLSSYVNQAADPTLNQFASKDQQAKMDALSKLGGVEDTFLGNAAQAGSYDPSKAVSIDPNLQRKIALGQTDYNTALSAPGQVGNADDAGMLSYGLTNPNISSYKDALQKNIDAEAPYQAKSNGYYDAVSRMNALNQVISKLQTQYGANNNLKVTA